jgi:hypothetical protein
MFSRIPSTEAVLHNIGAMVACIQRSFAGHCVNVWQSGNPHATYWICISPWFQLYSDVSFEWYVFHNLLAPERSRMQLFHDIHIAYQGCLSELYLLCFPCIRRQKRLKDTLTSKTLEGCSHWLVLFTAQRFCPRPAVIGDLSEGSVPDSSSEKLRSRSCTWRRPVW